MKTLGEKIRERRLQFAMTQEELAFKVGYKGRQSINGIELGKVDIPLSKLPAFAKALNVTPSYFISDMDTPEQVLSDKDMVMLQFFNDLTDEGQDKLLEYAYDLGEIDKYKRELNG